MEEIVTIDGMQYRLSYNQPISEEQRLQTIEEIRRSNSHDTFDMIVKSTGQANNIKQLSAGMLVS